MGTNSKHLENAGELTQRTLSIIKKKKKNAPKIKGYPYTDKTDIEVLTKYTSKQE